MGISTPPRRPRRPCRPPPRTTAGVSCSSAAIPLLAHYHPLKASRPRGPPQTLWGGRVSLACLHGGSREAARRRHPCTYRVGKLSRQVTPPMGCSQPTTSGVIKRYPTTSLADYSPGKSQTCAERRRAVQKQASVRARAGASHDGADRLPARLPRVLPAHVPREGPRRRVGTPVALARSRGRDAVCSAARALFSVSSLHAA